MRHPLAQLVLSLLLISNYVQANEMDACYQVNFRQIDRMADLPQEVVELIHANNRGERSFSALPQEEQIFIKSGQLDYRGIADRGGPFSPGCGPVGNEAMVRLVMAAISPACILVALEHGGAAHGAGLRVFLREGESWVRGDKFEHPRAYLSYQGKFETDLPTFVTQAEFELGGAYKYGQGVKKDSVESLKWYLLAANQGHGVAQFELGNIYAEGRGTEKNLKTALTWFEKAATTNAEFEYRLGKIYMEGTFVPQNVKSGLRKVKSAASRENPNAQVYLGELYLNGKHVKQNYVKAEKLFKKSLYHGGRYNLANMYKDGFGVEKNIVVAWALLTGSHEYSYKKLPALELTAQDLQEAKQLKNDMDGYFSPQGYIAPKGVLTALALYLDHQ
ncbi:MAG TPA: tetratricopeptide repeat protein [Methylotenera sp.]|nr:tetratricopeptide repeat protein [Methylotenera sp.]